MPYGPFAPRQLPPQDEARVRLLAERAMRAMTAHEKWATTAKKAVDFVEGRQWTEEQIAKLRKQGRWALTFNKIAPIIRSTLGFFSNNKTEIRALAGHDGTGIEDTAEIITSLFKQAAEANQLEFKDVEVFMDGLVTGRGYYDDRLDFSRNDFGDLKTTARDPFGIKLDPDGHDYDLNESCNYIFEDRWVSVDEIEAIYGPEAAQLVGPMTRGETPLTPITSWVANATGDQHPVRAFGGYDDETPEVFLFLQQTLGDFVDTYRKTIRLFDFQYYVRKTTRVFIDLETGQRQPVPDTWDDIQIEKALFHADEVGNPLYLDVRSVPKIRWTTLIGDLMAYDAWSPYETFTITPYFPYFRQGHTRGMVADLIDPQTEINKRRSVAIEIVGRTSHSGWDYHENALDAEQESRLQKFGSTPGYLMKWKGTVAPKKIEPSPFPHGLEKLDERANEEMAEISGLNKSAMGELDKVQSGRAIEARQRSAVLSIQPYLDNYSRTKELQGRKELEIFQYHYTEERILRIAGEDGQLVTRIINQSLEDPNTGALQRLNDIGLGTYSIAIDQTPFAASMMNAQFEELMLMIEKGVVPAQMAADILIDLSTIPRKDEIKKRMKQILQRAGLDVAGGSPQTALPEPGGAATEPGIALDERTDAGGNVTRLRPSG